MARPFWTRVSDYFWNSTTAVPLTLARAEPDTKAEPAGPSSWDRPRLITIAKPRDLPISSAQSFDNVQLVRAALQGLDQGAFNQAALLLDAMLGDSHIAAKLDDRIAGLFGAPFSMKPPNGLEEDAKALEVAGEAEEIWPRLCSDSAPNAIMRDGIMLGVGLGEILVEPGADEWGLRLKHWHMRQCYWRWDTRTYWISTMRGAEEIRPDGAGGHYSTWRDDLGQEQVSRWFVYTPYGYQRGWVNARVKAVAVPWLLRMWALRDWGRHSEILGIPPKAVKVPSEWNDDEKQRALKELASLASEGVILLPQKSDGTGFDVQLLELKGPNAKDTFDGLVERAESAITVALVGQTLTTQMSTSGGSRAAGEVHERVENKLTKRDARTVGDGLRSCVLRPWTEWNWGDPDLAPLPTWEVDPPEDLKAKGDGLKALGDGIASLKGQGIPVDRAKLIADAGVPVEEGVEFEEPEPPAPPPGTPIAEPDSTKLSRVEFARRHRAPVQGQLYADELADEARVEASRLLAGDLAAVRKVLSSLTPNASGGVDVEDLRKKLLEAYAGMDPSKLARLTEKVLTLAQLSGRYAVQKEATGPARASAKPDLGLALVTAAIADRPPATVTFQRDAQGRVLGATISTPVKE